MASNDITQPRWGYLIEPDKRPTPLFEQLLLALAAHIVKEEHITPGDTERLTPAKLCNFYRSVGGDYDTLFLHTAHASLSFIYRSLGCFHTLQPGSNPYLTPTIPALTPAGFVRWQTIQLLLDPADHARFLQESVTRFNLVNMSNGKPFPVPLPSAALPLQPDPEMIGWYHSVAEKLQNEVEACRKRPSVSEPPLPALSNANNKYRPILSDSDSVDTQSLLEASVYFHKAPLSTSADRDPWKGSASSFHAQQRSRSMAQVAGQHRWRSSMHTSEKARFDRHTRDRSSSPDSFSSCSTDCSSCSSGSSSIGLTFEESKKRLDQRRRAVTTSTFGAPPARSYSHGQLGGDLNGRGRTFGRRPQPSSTTLHNVNPAITRDELANGQKRRVHIQAGLTRAKTLGAGPSLGRPLDHVTHAATSPHRRRKR